MQMKDSVHINSGIYTFTNVLAGVYVIYSHPDTTLYPNAMATYYGDTINWWFAKTVTVTCAKTYTLSIKMKDETAASGKGSVSGTLNDFPSTPLAGVDINLGKTGGTFVMQTKTDNLGFYEFEKIDTGNYTIYVDIPGLPMDSTHQIVITATDTVFTQKNYFADLTKVFVDPASFVFQIQTENNFPVKVYPNPYSGFTNIEYTLEKTQNVSVEVYNLLGEKIHTTSYIQTPGMHRFRFSAAEYGYPEGTYLLRLQTENSSSVTRLVEIK